VLARVCCSLGTGSSASTVRTCNSCHTLRPSICSKRVVHVSKCTCGAPSPVIETECCVTTLTASKCRVREIHVRAFLFLNTIYIPHPSPRHISIFPHLKTCHSQSHMNQKHLRSIDMTFSLFHPLLKIIMSEEMGSARDQTGISARRFDKTGPISHQPRPESRLSDSSDECRADPVLKNTSINQSTSFKKLMNSVMCETEF